MRRAMPYASTPAQTTMLAATALMEMDESFLMNTDKREGFQETIVDRSMGWITAQCETYPELASVLDNCVKMAENYLDSWETLRVRR